MGLSQPTLSRQVGALEEELGVSLFERSSKGLKLTSDGEELLLIVKDMARLANRLSLSATSRSEKIEGKVTISVTDMIAMHLLPDVLKGLSDHAPGIDIEIISTDKTSDLQEREADIAIRASRPKQHELIARRLRKINGKLYASSQYIDKLGRPVTKKRLQEANFVGFATDSPNIKFLEQYANLKPTRTKVLVDSTIIQWEYIRKGMGVGFIPEDVALKEPLLEQVLPEVSPLSFEIWLVVHRELRTSRRLQIVFDYIANRLSD